MLFNIYGDMGVYQLLAWVAVFVGLVLLNEIARRSKAGGVLCFIVVPAVLTVYFIAIAIGAAKGQDWALNNQTHVYQNSWFHYAKLYAATIGCIGFMFLKYKWGIGKKEWFKVFPFLIVAINILIAVASDFESAIKGGIAGGWWNWVNGIAGLINIFCMTGWWGIYSSKDEKDMLWPDMTWCYILAYDLWNFEYTYNNLPSHSWYCGLALLLAPTFANAFWNKGGWIQNRANTLAIWCMFAQVLPLFQDKWVPVLTSVYPDDYVMSATQPASADPRMQGIIAVIALVANVIVFAAIIKRSVQLKKNPYKNEIFTHQKDYKLALARAAEANKVA